MTLFGNVIVAVVKHFFVKQAECLKDRRLYILLKTCVSQQLSWQSGVNTQEQWRSKGLVLTLRLHWMLLQLKKKKNQQQKKKHSNNVTSSFLKKVKQIHLKCVCLESHKD